MPEDRTLPHEEPLPEKVRRPDRITEYARRGTRQLAVVLAVTVAFVILLNVLLYEVLGNRDDLAKTVLSGVVLALGPVTLFIISVRQKR